MKKFRNAIRKAVTMLTVFAFAAGMVTASAAPESFAASPVTVYVNGAKLASDAAPYISNNRVMVPVRAVSESLGGSILWNSSRQEVTISSGSKVITMRIGKNLAYVNGKKAELDAPPVILATGGGGGRTMVPVRFIAENLGCKVDWVDKTRTVKITGPFDDSVKIVVNGVRIETDAEPYIKNNKTMVPAAVIVEYLGGESSWDGAAKKVTITEGGNTVVMTINSTTAYVNGRKVTLEAAPEIKTVNAEGGGRTMIPLRFLAESLGYIVNWEDSTRTVTVDSPSGTVVTGPEQHISLSVEENKLISGKRYSVVTVKSDSSLKDQGIRGILLTDPYRYYMDFKNCRLASDSEAGLTTSSSSSSVSSVRSALQGDGSTYRVVVDLRGKISPTVSYSSDGCTMTLSFENQTESQNSARYEPDIYAPFEDGHLVVVLDPGHGDSTAGKRSFDGKLLEYEFNRDVAYRIKALLESKGVECIMTLSKNQTGDPSLKTRVDIANEDCRADVFVSIHANAYGTNWNNVTGWEIYYYKDSSKANPLSKKLAQDIHDSTFRTVSGMNDRGIKTANYYVIRYTLMPAVLVEHGFYTNKNEVERLKSSSFRQSVAQADANGIMAFLNSYK